MSDKPSKTLFIDVSEKEYDNAFMRLVEYRRLYPHYRDDELLLKLLIESSRPKDDSHHLS